jgi:Flp pilus assembly pilin Flp
MAIVATLESKRRKHMIDRLNLWALQLVGRVQSVRREEGQALVEYALILSLISVVAVAALKLIGTNVTAVLNKIAGDISAA